MAKSRKSKIPKGDPDARQLRFVTEYLVDLNATQAAIRAGYAKTGASVQACRLLGNPKISAAIAEGLQKLLDKPASEATKVIMEAACIAHSDVRELFTPEGFLRNIKDLPDEIARAVASVEVVQRPTGKGKDAPIENLTKVRLWDKNAALGLLAKYHKLLVEKIEHSGQVAVKTVTAEELDQLSLPELKARGEAIAKRALEITKGLR